MIGSDGTSGNYLQEKDSLKIEFRPLIRECGRQLSRGLKTLHGFVKAPFMRLIGFYQKHLSRHTCLYTPTCSEYTKRCINNLGVIAGILLGIWRILRCNPFSKGGYDPAPELRCKKKWLV